MCWWSETDQWNCEVWRCVSLSKARCVDIVGKEKMEGELICNSFDLYMDHSNSHFVWRKRDSDILWNISKFVDRIEAAPMVMGNVEYWFRTKEQIDFFSDWIKQSAWYAPNGKNCNGRWYDKSRRNHGVICHRFLFVFLKGVTCQNLFLLPDI